jgi:hypothetical protein
LDPGGAFKRESIDGPIAEVGERRRSPRDRIVVTPEDRNGCVEEPSMIRGADATLARHVAL